MSDPSEYVDDTAYSVWLEENMSDLQEEFLKICDPADIPLDDDMPDWFADNDEFHAYCEEQFGLSVDPYEYEVNRK